MITVSVTRFRLRSGNPVSLMLFFWHTLRSARQAERTPGFLGGKLFNDANHTYWTVTLWESEEAMRTFRSGGEHQRAMRAMKLLERFCSEAAVVSYQAPSPELPNAETMYEKLIQQGRFYKLTHPSTVHVSRALPRPCFGSGRLLTPRRTPRTLVGKSAA
jgi:heme-degrading monooxygenase HmoA